jgi:dihydrodipicolinate synthase/N-acetylneuraminate lyase
MGKKTFPGIISAIFTPFDEKLNFDERSFRLLIDFQIQAKVNALWFLGSAGLGPGVDQKLQEHILDVGLDQTKRRVPVLVNVGTASTLSSLSLLDYVVKREVDGVALLTPFYYMHDEFELYQHYKAIASRVELPIILYNNPTTTRIDLKPEFMQKLHSDFPNIIGVKETTENVHRVILDLVNLPRTFGVYPSFETQILATLPFGARGVVSPVIPNIFPELIVELAQAITDKKWELAVELQNLCNELSGILASSPGTARYRLVAQEVLAARGLKVSLAVPWAVKPLSKEEADSVRARLAKTGLLEKYGKVKT